MRLLLNAELELKVLRLWLNRHLMADLRPRHRWAAQALVAVESALLAPDLAYCVPRSGREWLSWLLNCNDQLDRLDWITGDGDDR